MAYLGNIPLYFVTLVLYTLIKVLYFLFVYVILLKKKRLLSPPLHLLLKTGLTLLCSVGIEATSGLPVREYFWASPWMPSDEPLMCGTCLHQGMILPSMSYIPNLFNDD